jgi:hypothetical protein
MSGYKAIAWLMADHAGHVRGEANRAADVAAKFQRSETAGQRRR